MDSIIMWLACAVAAVAAALAITGWRGERTRRGRLEAERDRLKEELAAVHRERRRRQRARSSTADESGELRRRVEKAKRRAAAAREQVEPLQARVAELEGQLGERDSEIEARDREQRSLALRLAESQEAAKSARAVVAPSVTPTAQPSAAPELERLRTELSRSEEEASSRAAALLEAERETARYRQRARTHQRLYLVIRGELDLAKDRIWELRQIAGELPDEATAEAISEQFVARPRDARPPGAVVLAAETAAEEDIEASAAAPAPTGSAEIEAEEGEEEEKKEAHASIEDRGAPPELSS